MTYTTVISAFKPVRRRDRRPLFAVRLDEVEGRDGTPALRLPFWPAPATAANLIEDAGNALPVGGRTVRVPIGPYQLKTVRVAPAGG